MMTPLLLPYLSLLIIIICLPGCDSHEHCGDQSDDRRDPLRGGPGLCEAEGLQLQDGDGLPCRHSHLTGTNTLNRG